jgi:acyl-CoA synthetase (NDP forming)
LYEYLFHPKSIVVVGASSNSRKPGGRVLKNIKENAYQGLLWAINPRSPSIMGLPTFKAIEDLPETPELALIAIPAPMVRESLESLARLGTKAVIILTAGFGEKDEKGKLEEQKFLEIADRADMTIIGPNCSGFLTTSYAGKFAGLIPTLKKGSVDFISGSGATVDYVMEQANFRGLSFSNVVNLGNSIQTGVEDILAMVDDHFDKNSAPILMLYMEQVKKPDKLLKHARSLTRKGCTIVGIKSGVTGVGQRAAASHTGAIATNDSAVQALFDKAGIIRVKSKAELIDVGCVLYAAVGQHRWNRVGIVTDAGGPGVMLSDELTRQNLEVPMLGEKTRKRLSGILPPEGSTNNPIDCLPTRNAEIIREILKTLEEEEKERLDVIVVITGNSGMSDNWEIYQEIIHAMDRCPIPVIPVLSSATSGAEDIKNFKKADKFYFPDEVVVGQTLGIVARRPAIYDPQMRIRRYDKSDIKDMLASQGKQLSPDAVRGVLAAAGFKVPAQMEVFDKRNLPKACESIGFPMAMKVIGPLHKSDVGGVRLDINTYDEVEDAWSNLLKIETVSGVMLQPMIKGVEVILGAIKEENFGHLIMFGLGGIYTEVLRDVSFGLSPLSKEESMRMIRQTKSLPLLEGVRGEKGVSLDLLSEYLIRLGLLLKDFPQIVEIDLNPVKGLESDLYVVDARIIQSP